MHGIAQAHPFADGNKRTGWGCAVLYLRVNGYRIRDMGAEESGTVVLDLVNGVMTIDDAARWIATHLQS